MSELAQELAQGAHTIKTSSIDSSEAIRQLKSMTHGFSSEDGQPMSALLWIFGELKQRQYVSAIIPVIEKGIRKETQFPFTVVCAAFDALRKINDKSCFDPFLELFRIADDSDRLMLASLFKYLFSTKKLLSIHALEEDYESESYWDELYAPHSVDQWNQFDTESLFWEYRFLAVQRLDPGDPTLKNLLDDEVSIVRDLAESKLLT